MCNEIYKNKEDIPYNICYKTNNTNFQCNYCVQFAYSLFTLTVVFERKKKKKKKNSLHWKATALNFPLQYRETKQKSFQANKKNEGTTQESSVRSK